jgi:hypothetical protein
MPIPIEVFDETPPVSDELLGDLYRADAKGLAVLVETIPPRLRALLAVYCFRRGHLQRVGLAIASTCTEQDLIDQGGMAGVALCAKSRELLQTPPRTPGHRTITLPAFCVPVSSQLNERTSEQHNLQTRAEVPNRHQ